VDSGSPGSDRPGTIVTALAPDDFFREELARAIANQRAEVREETSAYLVKLLSDFLEAEAFYQRDEAGHLEARPLAFLLKDAVAQEGPMRLALLRRLGDTSLFVSGFFAESLVGKAVGPDYYAAMGERAYEALGDAVARHSRTAGELVVKRTVFQELAARFKQLAQLLEEVSERTAASTNAGLLRLYDKFLRTGSMRLSCILRGQGMAVPIPVVAPRGRMAQ
jgi:hypothetical protein